MKIPNHRIEHILLNKIMLGESKYIELLGDRFEKRWFESQEVAISIEHVIGFHKKYNKMPTKDVMKLVLEHYENKNDLTVGDMYRVLESDLSADLSKFSVEFIDENIIGFIKHQSILHAITDNFDSIKDDHNVGACIEVFKDVNDLTFDNDIGMDYFEDWEEHANYLINPEDRTPTGYPQLDEVFNGGLYTEGKCLIVPIAQAGLGKSVFLSNIGVKMALQGKNVVVASLEMSEDIYASRFDAHISKSNLNLLGHNIDSVRSKVYEMRDGGAGKIVIKEFTPGMLTCNALSDYLGRLKLEGITPDVVMIDYISLMKANDSSGDQSMYTRVGNIAKEIRALSYIHSCPFIAPQQINGDSYDSSDITMGSMSESKAVNHHADAIIALYKDELSEAEGKIYGVVLKNRLGGRVGAQLTWSIDYVGSSLCMEDWEDSAIDMTPTRIKDETKSIEDEILSDINNI